MKKKKMMTNDLTLDPSIIKGKIKLRISLPLVNDSIHINTDLGLSRAALTSVVGEKLEITRDFVGSGTPIDMARNILAARFLASDDEWQLQIDPGLVFPTAVFEDIAGFYSSWLNPQSYRAFMKQGMIRQMFKINVIDELLRSAIKYGKTMVGGLCFINRGISSIEDMASIPNPDGSPFDISFTLADDNHIDTSRLGAQFLLVHRSVYEDIERNYPELRFTNPVIISNKPAYAYYQPMVVEDNIIESVEGTHKAYSSYLDGEFAFSERASKSGHKPCINMNILLGNMGDKVYSWLDRPPIQKHFIDLMDNNHE